MARRSRWQHSCWQSTGTTSPYLLGRRNSRVFSHENADNPDKAAVWRDAERHIRYSMLRGGTNAYGLEIKQGHLQRLSVGIPQALNFLNKIGFAKQVVLERQNYLRIVVSATVASKTKQYHVRSGGNKANRIKNSAVQVELDADRVIAGIDVFANFYAQLKSALGQDCLWLTYEQDVLEDPTVAYHKILGFCELPPHPVTVQLDRTNPHKLPDIIINFEEIRDRLRATRYEALLEEENQ
ncbi:MAG: hypothetical protein HC890_10825 [Chloroflexaceae bacterium]|nr:hypothetical protein [Chloroflexaceae bacterium]